MQTAADCSLDDHCNGKFQDLRERMARVEATMEATNQLLLPLVRDVHEIRESVKHRGGFVAGFTAALGILVGIVFAIYALKVGGA